MAYNLHSRVKIFQFIKYARALNAALKLIPLSEETKR